jgi:hypothetical protein
VSSSDPEPTAAFGGYSILQGSLDEVRSALATHPFVTRGGTLQLNETVDPAALAGWPDSRPSRRVVDDE